MRLTFFGASCVLAVSIASQAPTQGEQSPQAAFTAFQDRAGGQWIAQWHAATGTPSAIYGTGLPIADWRENTLEEARRHATQLLATEHDLLGLGTSDFREVIGARMGRTWSFTFDQFFKGLPVIEGRADVRVNMRGVVAMFGSRAWPIPADFDVTPAIGDDVATAVAWDALDATPPAAGSRGPQLCIWGDIASPTAAPVYLAWEVPVDNLGPNGTGPLGRYYIDAKTAAVLHYTNDRHECGMPGCTAATHAARAIGLEPTSAPATAVEAATQPLHAPVHTALPIATTVTVMGWTRTSVDGSAAPVNVPLPGLVLSVPGIGTMTTDQNGQFSINISSSVTITVGALDGRHHAPIIVAAGAGWVTTNHQVDPGVDTTIQLLTAGATGADLAHTTTSWWVDKANEWARSILGNTAQLTVADNIQPNLNVASACNASYSPAANRLNFFATGTTSTGVTCVNTAFSTVIAHEWGHGLDDRYGGISNSNPDGLSEGWGDIAAMYLVDSNLNAVGFFGAGSFLRNGYNSTTYPSSSSDVHVNGQVWMGFAWELRDRLRAAFGTPTAIAISNDIVIGSIVADATTQIDAVREVFLADDDDGNLINGVPHYTQLSGAATIKNLPYPEQILATYAHVPLIDTNERLRPREVFAAVVPNLGTISQVKLHFDTGGGTTIRTMHPTSLPNTYFGLLPGVRSGSVNYHFETLLSGGQTSRYPSSGSFSYIVDAASGQPFTPFYTEGFESGGVGWTSVLVANQNDWQVGDPAGKSGTVNGVFWSDPQVAATGTNCYGNDLGNTIGTTTWNGAYATNVSNFLLSPVINCSGQTGVRLRFKRWLTVEDGQYDHASILVNGVQVWENPVGSDVLDTSWQDIDIPIAMADNNPVVQLQWRLQSDAGVQYGGWNIDDVQLGTANVPALGAELELLPEQVVQGGIVNTRIQTQAPSLPWLLGIGDAPGPVSVPGFPTFSIGGNLGLIGGTTDGTGLSQWLFVAPTVPSALGMLTYTQVLTIDATFTQWVVSNPFVSFFTQTP